jgi:hypothetical protein
LNVVGWNARLTIRTPDKSGESAQNWFNKKWAPNSDFRDGLHLAEQWGLLIESVWREGDAGVLFDRYLKKTGRVAYYESDQICDPPPDSVPKGCESFDGVIRDEFGRMVGICVARDRGLTVAQKDRYTIFPRDPEDESKNMFKLVRMPWRFNQGRGVSPMLTPLADLLDCYEMRAKELQTAKVAAGNYASVKRKEAVEDYDDERLSPDYKGPASADPAASATLPEKANAENTVYDRLGAVMGGAVDYLDDGDEVDIYNPTRPNVHMAEFIDHVIRSGGSGVGLARCYAEMRAESSYTAFRGEMVLTWVLFEYIQKWLENEAQDWTAQRAINFGIEHKLCDAPSPGWETELFWPHPKMPSVDEGKEQSALTQKIKNGDIDVDELFGPDFEAWLQRYAEKMNKIKEVAPWFAAFELKSGGQIKEETPANGTDDDNDDDDETKTKGAK